MNFIVANQLPPALARFIQSELKTKAAHVADLGLREASDAELWTYASTHELILVSKDGGFRPHGSESTHGQANLGASWQLSYRVSAGTVSADMASSH